MKRIILSGILSTSLLFGACQKETKTSVSTKKNSNHSQGLAQRLSLPENPTEDMTRIYNDVVDNDYEVGIIDNAMFGIIDNSGHSINLGGKTDPNDNITVTLNDNIYSAKSNGQWGGNGADFKNYIGTTVTVTIKSGTVEIGGSVIYVPTAHLAPRLLTSYGDDACSQIKINRTGNTFTWTPDPSNKLGYIILNYRLYGPNGYTNFSSIPVEDNGSYKVDDILSDASANLVEFDIISGNTTSGITSNSKKILFYISTWDHHSYFIR